MTHNCIVQSRIAEVAGDVSNWTEDIGKMLVAMLTSDSDDVVEASIDSLHSIAQSSPDRLQKAVVSQALEAVRPQKSPLVATVLESLKRRISGPL